MKAAVQHPRTGQRGISIVLVLFLLAVIGVMALSLVKISGTQHMSSTYTYMGTQSYFAARAGLEWAAARAAGGGSCAASATLVAAGRTVTVTCASSGPFDEGDPSSPYFMYQLTATASDGGFQVPDVSNRRVNATVKAP